MGSVAAGAMVVGTSLLVVFALATAAIDHQLESSLEELDRSNTPLPELRVIKAQNIEEAVIQIDVTDGGEDIVCVGTCQLRLGTGGNPPIVGDFTAEFTLCDECNNAGIFQEVDQVTITNHGSYLNGITSGLSLYVSNVNTVTTPPSFTFVVNNVVYADVENIGTTSIDTEHSWVTIDGVSVFQFKDLLDFENGPTSQLTINSTDPFPTMYPGEVFTLQHITGGTTSIERLTVVTGGIIAAKSL